MIKEYRKNLNFLSGAGLRANWRGMPDARRRSINDSGSHYQDIILWVLGNSGRD